MPRGSRSVHEVHGSQGNARRVAMATCDDIYGLQHQSNRSIFIPDRHTGRGFDELLGDELVGVMFKALDSIDQRGAVD